jgi:hypothetical protein
LDLLHDGLEQGEADPFRQAMHHVPGSHEHGGRCDRCFGDGIPRFRLPQLQERCLDQGLN